MRNGKSCVPQPQRILCSIGRHTPGIIGERTLSTLNTMESVRQISATLLMGVVAKSMMEARSFEDELAFYGSYHQDPINQAIHFVFVPTIWWSICVGMAYIDIPGLKGATVPGTKHPLTFATLMYLAYASYYLYLDIYCGGIFSFVLALLYLQASSSVQKEKLAGSKYHGTKMWKIAFVLHAIAWYMQIHPGHAIFEKVKPALLDSLGQSFGVAPLFAFLEGFWALGFASELKHSVVDAVRQRRLEMCIVDNSFAFC